MWQIFPHYFGLHNWHWSKVALAPVFVPLSYNKTEQRANHVYIRDMGMSKFAFPVYGVVFSSLAKQLVT